MTALLGAVGAALAEDFVSPTVAQLQGLPRAHQADWRDAQGTRLSLTRSSALRFAFVGRHHRIRVGASSLLRLRPETLAFCAV